MIRVVVAGILAASGCLLAGRAHAQPPATHGPEVTPRPAPAADTPAISRFIAVPETLDERNDFLKRRGEALAKQKIETVTPLPEQRLVPVAKPVPWVPPTSESPK